MPLCTLILVVLRSTRDNTPQDPFRHIFVILTVLVIISSLMACTAPALRTMRTPVPFSGDVPTTEPQPTVTEEPRELVVWSELFVVDKMRTDPDGAGRYGRYLKEQFEREHPGVTVKFEYHGWDEELFQNVLAALSTGTAPDVIVGENFFHHYAELGALRPLDDALTDVKDNLFLGRTKPRSSMGTSMAYRPSRASSASSATAT